ncbi:odorant receptor Or2-like isoform X1 [Diabrotica virgifera virgifera]|uniref:Odorant receptor n=1 Tax=Diabrotica virgifera virgifera TaxID=50390 RepID=A0ABM5KV36_DIAVI|nr:odorant receptor Or2-like isoform X1 [Diabrotica virgifera virgifera]
MKFCGTEPRAKRSWSGIIRCWFNILCTLGMIYLAALVFVLEKDLTFVKVTGAIDTIVLMSHCALKMVSIYLQQPIMFELLERKRLHFWDIENSSSKEKKEYRKKVLGYAQFVILFFTVASIIACSSFGLQPLYLRKKVLGVSTYIPQSISFYVLAIYESYALFVVCFGIIPFDISVVYMLCLISVQWKSLNIEIKNILDSNIDTLEDQQLFKAKAIRCVEHHNFLKRYIEDYNKSLSLGLLAYILVFVISNCLNAFIISSGPELRELVRRSLYQCNLSNQFILLYAIPAQFLSTETQISEEIVFDTKWYNTACKDKKLFIWMISSVAKREVALKAGKILTVNYEFTFKMYRSIISYYMFLRTMGSNH